MDSKNKRQEFKSMSRSLFIESLVGNIKEKYFFEKKLGSGGYGAVYLAKNKVSGKYQNGRKMKINDELRSYESLFVTNQRQILTWVVLYV